VIGDRDEIRLPESVGGLFELAFVSYGRRLPLYLGLAVSAFLVQGLLVLAAPKLALALHGLFAIDPAKTEGIRTGLVLGANFVIDAFICGLVTIGVVADLQPGTPAADRVILGDALARWWIFALLAVAIGLLFGEMLPEVLGSGDPTMLALLPIVLVFLGALSLATVVAAVDRTTNEALLPILSIGRSLQVALPFHNLGRLAIYSALFAVPLVVAQFATQEFELRHVPFADFWASIPIDALTVGPLQALATIFYLDFVRRLAAAAR
jgi:hypothetical protein